VPNLVILVTRGTDRHGTESKGELARTISTTRLAANSVRRLLPFAAGQR
jgi:hypothetical protein